MVGRKRLGCSEFDEEWAMHLLEWMDNLPVFTRDALLQAQKRAMYVRLLELSGRADFDLEGVDCQVVWYKLENELEES